MDHKSQFQSLSFFACQNSILRHYQIQNVKDDIQIRVFKINQFISGKVKKILRNSLGSISGKDKKFEAQAEKWAFYRKSGVTLHACLACRYSSLNSYFFSWDHLHPPNVEKLVICRAIFLAAGIFVGQF